HHRPATPEIYTLSLHELFRSRAWGTGSFASAKRSGIGSSSWRSTTPWRIPATPRPLRTWSAGSRGAPDRLSSFSPGEERWDSYREAFSLPPRSEEHTSELQSRFDLVCRLLLEKKKTQKAHLT